MRLLVLVCPLTQYGGAIFLGEETLEGRADPRHISSESARFSSRQECEASMWLLADGPVSLSDGVCAFLGNGPSLFWLGKSKPFMLWSGKN